MGWRSVSCRHGLSIHYAAAIDRAAGTWAGAASIPGGYFPTHVTRFNAFSIHGQGGGKDRM